MFWFKIERDLPDVIPSVGFVTFVEIEDAIFGVLALTQRPGIRNTTSPHEPGVGDTPN